MTYYKDITAEYEDIEDRYELMVERIRSITKEETVDMRYRTRRAFRPRYGGCPFRRAVQRANYSR